MKVSTPKYAQPVADPARLQAAVSSTYPRFVDQDHAMGVILRSNRSDRGAAAVLQAISGVTNNFDLRRELLEPAMLSSRPVQNVNLILGSAAKSFVFDANKVAASKLALNSSVPSAGVLRTFNYVTSRVPTDDARMAMLQQYLKG